MKAKARPQPPHHTKKEGPRYWVGALGLLCAIAYFPAWQAFFVKDDIILLTSARLDLASAMQHSWPGGFFRPTAELLFAIQYLIFDFHPLSYHLVSFSAHLGCAYLAFRLFNFLPQYRTIALLSAGLFALHPLNTETVSWISGQMSLFASLCTLAVVYLLGTTKRLALLLPIFILGLGFYENFLFVLLLWGVFCLFDDRFRFSLKPIPSLFIIICSIAYFYWRFVILNLGGGNYQTALSLKSGLLNAVYYLYLLAGGSALGGRVLHYQPEIIGTHFFAVFTPLLLLNVLLALIYSLYRIKRRDWPDRASLLPFIWIAAALLPTLFLTERPRRLAYLAVPGYSLLIGQSLFYLKEKTRSSPLITKTVLACYIFVFASTLHLRNYDWQAVGALERALPKTIKGDCQTLVFDLPNLIGDALFFNNLSTEKWLGLNGSNPIPKIMTPTNPLWDHHTSKPGCYYRYVNDAIHPTTNIKSEPIFTRGRTWVNPR
jgi:hypothetical protein